MTLQNKYFELAQQLGKRSINPNSVAYKRAQRQLNQALAAAQATIATSVDVGGAIKHVGTGVVILETVAGTTAAIGAGVGGSGYAAAATLAAAAGPIGLVATAAILGVAGTIAIVGAVRKGKANAEAASAAHGEKGREWGRAYMHYWNVYERDSTKLIDKADNLIERIDNLKAKKKQGKKRRNKIKRLQRRASALATVLLEVGFDVPPPAPSVTNAPIDPQQDALDSDDLDDADEDEKPSLLPKALIALSVLRLLL